MNNLAGGAWRGLEECWGIWGKFLVAHFIFNQEAFFHSLGSSGVVGPCLDQFLADLVEREETSWKKVKVLLSELFCCRLLYCQCLIRPRGESTRE